MYLNRLQSVATPRGSVAYTHDPAGNVKSVAVRTQAQELLNWTMKYDANERRKTMRAPEGDYVFAYSGTNGRPQTVETPSGITMQQRYDNADRVTKIEWKRTDNTMLRSFAGASGISVGFCIGEEAGRADSIWNSGNREVWTRIE